MTPVKNRVDSVKSNLMTRVAVIATFAVLGLTGCTADTSAQPAETNTPSAEAAASTPATEETAPPTTEAEKATASPSIVSTPAPATTSPSTEPLRVPVYPEMGYPGQHVKEVNGGWECDTVSVPLSIGGAVMYNGQLVETFPSEDGGVNIRFNESKGESFYGGVVNGELPFTQPAELAETWTIKSADFGRISTVELCGQGM